MVILHEYDTGTYIANTQQFKGGVTLGGASTWLVTRNLQLRNCTSYKHAVYFVKKLLLCTALAEKSIALSLKITAR